MGTRNSKTDMEQVYAKRDAEANQRAHEQFMKAGSGGGGGSSCFPGNALVRTATGWKKISNIEQGTKVIALDEEGRFVERVVLCKRTYGRSEIREVRDMNGAAMFRATGSHSVLTKAGWKKVAQLKKGDLVVSYEEDNEAQISRVGLNAGVGSEENVYNLVVAGEFTFVVKGCTAHSFTYARELQVSLWRAKAVGEKLFKLRSQDKRVRNPLFS